MQVVWEADTAAFASRKRAARACPKCRSAKKRCHHTFQRPADLQGEADGLDKVLPNLTHKEPIRFVGDLNPESILTELSSASRGQAGSSRISRIGTWVERPRENSTGLAHEDLAPAPKTGEKTPTNVEKYGKVEGGRRHLTSHQRNYLQAVGAFRVLPKTTQDALISTYVACIDGLLPIMEGTRLMMDYTAGRCSIFLIQAICLVTCKTEEAAPYLRLYDDGPLLDPIPFARSLHTGLDAAMKADLEPDRVTKIQILTLMHLHNDGPGGIEESSLHLSQAIHDAWTAGLHIQTPGRTLKDQNSMLWWTLWTLDKINACLGGRPIMIANRDIDIARPRLESDLRSQVITAWLRLGDLLDEVIEFYRPTADPDSTGWESDFPSFASLTGDIDLDGLGEPTRGMLEILYNITAILSCRSGGISTTSYARRIQAANRIQTLMTSCHLAPIPLVPYAVGLSLTVAYRGLRDNASSESERGIFDLQVRSEALERLSNFWWTADAMARLGRQALKSLRVPGVRRGSVMGIANAMEAEVTVCKFGPFEKKITDETSTETPGNALHVLSDAAATHSSSHSQAPNHGTNRSSELHTATPSLSTASRQDDNSTSGGHLTTLAPTPAPFAQDTGPTPVPLDVNAFDQFNNLDDLFENLFDLSMPTIFQDPVFDGDAFLNANMDFGGPIFHIDPSEFSGLPDNAMEGAQLSNVVVGARVGQSQTQPQGQGSGSVYPDLTLG